MRNTITKEQLNMFLENLNIAVKNDIEDIKHFDESDTIRLEKAMIQNLRNLKKYDAKTLKISKKLDLMYEKEKRLTRQANYTRSIIINETESEVKRSIAVLTVYAIISSNNFSEFIRKTIILLMIDSLTFNFNIAYFTSNERKELVKKRLEKLKTNIVNEEINYRLYKEINKCFTLKLDTQYEKLLDLYPEIDEEKIKKKSRGRN